MDIARNMMFNSTPFNGATNYYQSVRWNQGGLWWVFPCRWYS